MTVNKTATARDKYRTETPIGKWKARFIYDLDGNTVYGVWVNLPEIIANGLMTANDNPHMRVISLEIEMVNQPPRIRRDNAKG